MIISFNMYKKSKMSYNKKMEGVSSNLGEMTKLFYLIIIEFVKK